jgi:hypothetical protein
MRATNKKRFRLIPHIGIVKSPGAFDRLDRLLGDEIEKANI